MSGVPSGGDRLAEIETWVYNGNYASGDDVLALVEIAKAARELHDFLENEKETHEPPRYWLDRGYVALERSADYEKEEELNTALGAALARLDSGAAE